VSKSSKVLVVLTISTVGPNLTCQRDCALEYHFVMFQPDALVGTLKSMAAEDVAPDHVEAYNDMKQKN
jgi:hypothetical protein